MGIVNAFSQLLYVSLKLLESHLWPLFSHVSIFDQLCLAWPYLADFSELLTFLCHGGFHLLELFGRTASHSTLFELLRSSQSGPSERSLSLHWRTCLTFFSSVFCLSCSSSSFRASSSTTPFVSANADFWSFNHSSPSIEAASEETGCSEAVKREAGFQWRGEGRDGSPCSSLRECSIALIWPASTRVVGKETVWIREHRGKSYLSDLALLKNL